MIWKRNTVSLQETAAAKAYLEDMARDGLFLENASLFRGLQFREDVPAEMDYRVIHSVGELPEVAKQEYIDNGWTFVCRAVQTYVFCAPAGAESPAEKTRRYRWWAEEKRKNRKWSALSTILYFLAVGGKVYDICCEGRDGNFIQVTFAVYAVSLYVLVGLLLIYSDFCGAIASREIENEEGDISTINWQRWRNKSYLARTLAILYLLLFVVMFAMLSMCV